MGTEVNTIHRYGDGNCLFRAFAEAYYRNQNHHVRVRHEIQEFWARAMDTFGVHGNRERNPVYDSRNIYYEALLEQSRDASRSADVPTPQIQPLDAQILQSGVWASTEMLQILADAYGVTLIAHIPQLDHEGRYQDSWAQVVRGAHPLGDLAARQRQIHVAFYPRHGHFTALDPVLRVGAPRFTAHTVLAQQVQAMGRAKAAIFIADRLAFTRPIDINYQTFGELGLTHDIRYLDYRGGGVMYRPWFLGC